MLLGRDQESDVRVAKVMEPKPLQPELGDPAVEHLGDRLWIERVAGLSTWFNGSGHRRTRPRAGPFGATTPST